MPEIERDLSTIVDNEVTEAFAMYAGGWTEKSYLMVTGAIATTLAAVTKELQTVNKNLKKVVKNLNWISNSLEVEL